MITTLIIAFLSTLVLGVFCINQRINYREELELSNQELESARHKIIELSTEIKGLKYRVEIKQTEINDLQKIRESLAMLNAELLDTVMSNSDEDINVIVTGNHADVKIVDTDGPVKPVRRRKTRKPENKKAPLVKKK